MMTVRGNSRSGLFGATLGFFIGFAAVSLFGPTAKNLKDGMELTPLMVGFLVAMPSLSGSLLRIPFAAWVDSTGGRKPFLVLLALSFLGMLGVTWLIFTYVPDRLDRSLYPALLILGLISGCGIATFSVGVGQVSYWFPQNRQGSALGIYAGIGNLAPGLFSLLLPLALARLGLGVAYLAWLIFLGVGVVLYYYFGLNSPYFQLLHQGQTPEKAREGARQLGQEIFPAGSLKTSLFTSARVWKTWALVAIYFCTFGGFIALTSWLPTYYSTLFALGGVAAGGLAALYSISASLIRVAGGSLSDRYGGEQMAMIGIVVMMAGALLFSFSGSLTAAVIAELLMAVGMGVGNGAVFKLVPQAVPRAVGGAAGWVGGLGAFGGFAIPPLLSAFVVSKGMAGYSLGFLTFAVLGVISLGLVLLLRQAGTGRPRTEPAKAV